MQSNGREHLFNIREARRAATAPMSSQRSLKRYQLAHSGTKMTVSHKSTRIRKEWKTLLCVLVLLGSRRSLAQGGPLHNLDITPIDVSVPSPPVAFKADGHWNLAYELRILSFSDLGDATITSIQILGDHKPLVTLSGDALKASVDPKAFVGTKLGPRTYTTIFMWMTADSLGEIPLVLQHRVAIEDKKGEFSTETQQVPVDRKPVIVISPPLRGDDWAAWNGPSPGSVHRRAVLPIQGKAFIGQRFAIDWVQVYPDGESHRGDKLDNRNYHCYGQPVYAVADGIITEIKDGIPENTPGPDSRAVEMTMETVPGNHVIERIADGAYATFAHLQPGSLKVKLGDHVHRGQVLGLLGNSGNSTEPHLHFQICDSNSVLGCEGLPYALPAFEVEGLWKPGDAPVKHAMELPTEGEVVKFSNSH